ncbi:keratin, type I cytoskeletal 13-like [Fagus crenata]
MKALVVIIMAVLAGTLVVYLIAGIFCRKRKSRKEINHSTVMTKVTSASPQQDFPNAGSGVKDGGMVVMGGATVATAAVASTFARECGGGDGDGGAGYGGDDHVGDGDGGGDNGGGGCGGGCGT